MSAATEQHYTVAEVAQMWGVSADWVRRKFRYAQGVTMLNLNEHPSRLHFSIPKSVLERVHREMEVKR